MTPARAEMEIYEGRALTLVYQIKDNSGATQNLTGATATLDIVESRDDAATKLSVTGTITDVDNGIVAFYMTGTDTDGFAMSRGKYTLEIDYGDTAGAVVYETGDVVYYQFGY